MSRKVLVPLVLPADPAAAMEAATKQYADGLVFIGPNDPIGTTPQTELWYDDDDPGIGYPNLPRGLIASSNVGGQVSCPTGTVTYLTNALAVTLLVGRKYRLQWSFRATGRQDGSTTLSAHKIALYDSTTELPGSTWMDHWHLFGPQWTEMAGFVYVNGDGVARSLRIGIGSPPVALYIFPTWFGIEDVGSV